MGTVEAAIAENRGKTECSAGERGIKWTKYALNNIITLIMAVIEAIAGNP